MLFVMLNERKEKYILKLVFNKNLFGIVYDLVYWVLLICDCLEVGIILIECVWIF